MTQWKFFIDRGGTFTDVIAESPDGTVDAFKLLSQSPHYDDAVLECIRRCLGIARNDPIPAGRIAELRMGTTVATNALLTRTGERTLLVTTRGMRDQLRIGYQNRPKLFTLKIELPDMLYERVVEADERVAANGEVLTPLDEDALRAELMQARADGIAACAILFMHGYRYPEPEKRAAEIARECGFTQISTSHETVALPKFVSRGDTTVADAYLSPVLLRYANKISSALEGTHISFMASNGGLTVPELFRGKDAIVSGPAGGVVGMAETAREAGLSHVIGFDMGGTSTDVSRFDGRYERIYETEIAGVRLRAPMMAINTVAAGGGSILHYDGARFRVGPDSAGADPGPLGYRRGGPLTVTDANVLVGKLKPSFLPPIFGPNGDQPLDENGVRVAFEKLARDIGDGRTAEDVADGFIRIAVENMANAIRRISVAKGYDPRDYALNCFGGAGGQHACLVAEALGMTKVFVHPYAGVLSAYGMKLATFRTLKQRALGIGLTESNLSKINEAGEVLAREATHELAEQGAHGITTAISVHLRYEGSDTTLGVALASIDDMKREFAERHARLYGFGYEGRALIAESIEAEAESAREGEHRTTTFTRREPIGPNQESKPESFYSRGRRHTPRILLTDSLQHGTRLTGPLILYDQYQTLIVEDGWNAEITDTGAVLLTRENATTHTLTATTAVDPVSLEVFANLFMAIAEEMGATLQNTASSVNIKERLDFSCAIFDAEGGLVANAPHMPVHLGSMGDCVTALMKKHPDMRDGDMFATNAPYDGGTHLPDITVVAPVFVDGERRFFIAARGHHADIGGITPGSMPPFSHDIAEEGVLFNGIRMVREGHFEEDAVRTVLGSTAHPARNPEQNIADLKAQSASCARGISELRRVCTHYGADVVTAYMRHVQDNAEESVRKVIGALKDGEFAMPMDGGMNIKVKITVDRAARSARVDFTGTSVQQPNNFNAPGSVTKAAVLYVFRCLVDGDIPMNAGCLKPLEIVVPRGSLLNPNPPAAVAAGNVETSQAVCDALFGCLGVLAASQGTMNNLTFGNERHQYYETICGGAGAGASFDGQSAVQTHMTNSRLTDPEILESRYPVLLEEFRIREGSGRAGKHHGGDGVVRRIRFNEAMNAAILSTRRETSPFGLDGGGDAARGTTTIIRKNGAREILHGQDERNVSPGDCIEIATPGGGGFGKS